MRRKPLSVPEHYFEVLNVWTFYICELEGPLMIKVKLINMFAK